MTHNAACNTELMYPAIVQHLFTEPTMRKIFHGHTKKITCCAAYKDGTRIVTGSADVTLKIWDLMSGEVTHTFQGHDSSITCCTIASDTRVVSGSRDGTLKVWDPSNGLLVHTHNARTCSECFCHFYCSYGTFSSEAWLSSLESNGSLLP